MSDSATFHAEVRGGKAHLWDKTSYDGWISRFEDQRVVITVAPFRRRRSNDQNAYFHGVVLKMIADALEELGWEREEVKEFLKQKFLLVERDGKQFCRPTHTLNTKDMAEFTDRCIRWAAIELGLVIPDPNTCSL